MYKHTHRYGFMNLCVYVLLHYVPMYLGSLLFVFCACVCTYIYISTIVEIASPENHALISILVACMNPLDYFWLYTVGAG